MIFRIGHGYDAHRMADKETLILGGVNIPYERGLIGHSDADVLTHALIDALFGAAAMGDIGSHFPDTAEEYRNISSLKLLKATAQKLSEKGYEIINADITVLAQKPKLSPYIVRMRENIAGILKTDIRNISIKATTEEKMGFTGSGEGIAVHAVVLLMRK